MNRLKRIVKVGDIVTYRLSPYDEILTEEVEDIQLETDDEDCSEPYVNEADINHDEGCVFCKSHWVRFDQIKSIQSK